MRDYARPVEELIAELRKLPGIGSKSAQRLAFHIVRASSSEARGLAESILNVTDSIRYCSVCYNITDVDPCFYCTDPLRDRGLICVLEEPHNVVAVEKTREYRGLYHVLLGVLSPLNGIGPDQLKIKGLLERLKDGRVEEVIVATNPSVEGEATALYLSKLIKPLQVRVTRIAMGVPVGGDLDYADEITMARALEGRREL
ncbi:MAG: recombination mediator RecR [Acidobacteriota bacterium]|nr:recombination mediator RecR [Acidobacteriota bacterium]MDE2965834.1 recombination mediator RecR [Acidobacteriota bacterium]